MTIRGIDHVGVTVPSIEQATEFFVRALGAQVLYDTLPREDGSRGGEATDQRLGVPGGTDEIAIRMLRLPYGPGLELFEFTGPRQRDAAIPSDIEWQHVAIYADDLDAAAAQVVEAGGSLLAEPRPLPSVEAGERNRFVYARTPWGSTLEIISYPDEQPYNAGHGAAPLAALSRPWVGRPDGIRMSDLKVRMSRSRRRRDGHGNGVTTPCVGILHSARTARVVTIRRARPSPLRAARRGRPRASSATRCAPR